MTRIRISFPPCSHGAVAARPGERLRHPVLTPEQLSLDDEARRPEQSLPPGRLGACAQPFLVRRLDGPRQQSRRALETGILRAKLIEHLADHLRIPDVPVVRAI